MEFHKIADIFPLMEKEQFKEFVNDIKLNGQLESIYLLENKILDGRNRYNACVQCGIKPKYIQFTGKNPLTFVISSNLHRRHLNPYQRAEIVLKIKPEFAAKAKEKQIESGGAVPQKSVKPIIDTQKQLAKLANVSHDTIAKVETIKSKATEQQKERLKTGKSSINAVYKEVKRIDKKEEVKKIPQEKLKGKYNVFLADPPWQYDQTSTSIRGIADDHYPTMNIEDLKNLPVKEMVLDNAVLFLWTTTSMIRKAFGVMDAWGFEFKTSMCWIKQHIGTGFYVRSKHEIILIGIKGSFLPMTTDIPESVFNAPKSKHSKKPEIIYEIIEKMYPDQRKIELFARNTRENWKAWGNEL